MSTQLNYRTGVNEAPFGMGDAGNGRMEKIAAFFDKQNKQQPNTGLIDDTRPAKRTGNKLKVVKSLFDGIIGNSIAIKQTLWLVEQVACTDSTVLLLGETGTGKELIAKAVHSNSARVGKPLIKLNCATLPATLIESELFGHERGSFTGATDRRIGKFELANTGTIFLDEIGELPLELQSKLLRVLQEQEIERIGGRNTIKIDIRIIAATNRNLLQDVKEGKFRADLYYRLNVFPVNIPALRNRKEDIAPIAMYFVNKFSALMNRKVQAIHPDIIDYMQQYNWPGNIRELENMMERCVLMCKGTTINNIYLPQANDFAPAAPSDNDTPQLKTIDENERDHIISILKYSRGRVSGDGGAAEILGVPSTTLNSKMKRLGITKKVVG